MGQLLSVAKASVVVFTELLATAIVIILAKKIPFESESKLRLICKQTYRMRKSTMFKCPAFLRFHFAVSLAWQRSLKKVSPFLLLFLFNVFLQVSRDCSLCRCCCCCRCYCLTSAVTDKPLAFVFSCCRGRRLAQLAFVQRFTVALVISTEQLSSIDFYLPSRWTTFRPTTAAPVSDTFIDTNASAFSFSESSENDSSASDSGMGSEAPMMSPSLPTDPASNSLQLWPLVMYNGQAMQLIPNPLVPVGMLPPLPPVEPYIVGWAPAAVNNAFFAYPHLWPYGALPGVPSYELASQTMMHMAEQQQQQQQHYAAYQQNADSAAQECMAHLSPVPAYFPGFPVFHPQTSEEKEEGEGEEQETGQVQVQVQQQSVASKSVTGVSTASSQPSEAGLQLLAELAVARNQQEKLEDAARFGNTTVNN